MGASLFQSHTRGIWHSRKNGSHPHSIGARPLPLVSASGYTHPMATQRKQRNDRVQVPRDPALDRAIKRGRAAMGPSTPTSKVVRELALRGADAFEGDEAAEREAMDFALSVADGTSGLDLDRLRSARERAWGR